MPGELRKVAFTRELLDRVRNFSCGDEKRWELDAAAWIKNHTADPPCDCAVLSVELLGTQVWIYELADGSIVGYSSLGKSVWRIPAPKGEKKSIAVIPWVAIQKDFWGQPKGVDPQDRYSAIIIDDLIAGAKQMLAENEDKYLGLFVDESHGRAIRVYEKSGFVAVPGPYTDKATGVVYKRMLLDLSDYAA
jgi:hypothetical protein